MNQIISPLIILTTAWFFYYFWDRNFLSYNPNQNGGYFFLPANWPQPYHGPKKCPHCTKKEGFEYGHICSPGMSYYKLALHKQSGEQIQVPYEKPLRRFRAFRCRSCQHWSVNEHTLGADILLKR
ncbi:MAG: hypothetical protein WC693_02375 [Patescibacteria group bacterium]